MDVANAINTDFWPHPITTEGRDVVAALPGQTLEDVFRWRIHPHQRAIATVNGAIYSRDVWSRVVLKENDIVQVRTTVGGDIDPLAAILTIAVLVAAPYAAPYVAGVTGLSTAAATALVATGGLLIVNSLFPPRLPDIGGAGTGRARPQYSLASGGNQARPYQPIPLLLGEHRMFPDLVSQPYTEFDSSGDQFLNQIFDFGIGDLDVETPRIRETIITDFDSIRTQSDVASISLVAGNVDSINGGDLEYNTALQRTTATGTTHVAFDLSAQHFRVRDAGGLEGRDTEFRLEWKRAGITEAWNSRDITVSTPDGADARNAVRQSHKYMTSQDTSWDVRVTLLTEIDDTDDRLTFNASCSFRAFQDEAADFTGRNPLAVSAKATGQLYGRLDSVNAICGQLVPHWDGSQWTDAQRSGNPGDIYLAYLRGWYIEGNLVAGMGLEDARIDFESIQEFAEFCDTNELRCDLILEDGRSHNDAMTTILQCGWGSIDRQSGKWGVLWEDEGRPITAIINPDNVVAGSLAISYDHENLADEVIGNFVDRMSDYEVNQIRRKVPNVTNPRRPVEIQIDGIVNGEQAAKELNRQVAAQFYHIRTVTWSMTFDEARSIARGDVVGATHGLLGQGNGGRFLSISANRLSATVTQDVEASGNIWIWDLDEEVISTTFVRNGEREITLGMAIPSPASGVSDDPTAYRYMAFRASATERKLRVTSKQPEGNSRVRFVARDEVDDYYDHRTSDLTWSPIDVTVASHMVSVSGFSVTENELGVRIFSWTPHENPTVIGYQIRYSDSLSATWPNMDQLHDGLLATSPLELMDRPDAGTWRFAIVAIFQDGRRTTPRFITATLGEVTRGLDGDDGQGVEYIFAATENPTLPAAMRPSNDWGFDQPTTAGGLTWFDGASTDFSATNRYMWRCERAVPGVPEVGDEVEAEWSMPRIMGVWGQEGLEGADGADGDDGNGVEYIFARTSSASISSSQYPLNSWGFDSPGTRNGLTWNDGAPALTSSLAYLWRCERRVLGVPNVGASVSDSWSSPVIVGRFGPQGQPGVEGADGDDGNGVEFIFAVTAGTVTSIPSTQRPLNAWGFDTQPRTVGGLTWNDGAPNLTESLQLLWMSRRGIEGDDTVIGSWSTPVVVGRYGQDGAAAPRQWARLYNATIDVTGSTQRNVTVADIDNYDYISFLVSAVAGTVFTYYGFVAIPVSAIPTQSTPSSRRCAWRFGAESSSGVDFFISRNSSGTILRFLRAVDDRGGSINKVWGIQSP